MTHPRPTAAGYDIPGCIGAIEALHKCVATFIEDVRITEVSNESMEWNGTVHVFGVYGRDDADYCYAWLSSIDGERSYYAVLNVPPIDSPQAAVRLAIADQSEIDPQIKQLLRTMVLKPLSLSLVLVNLAITYVSKLRL
jgi:hypothetical protein